MKNKKLCSPNTRNEQNEEKDGEENDGSSASAKTLNTSERCPICLNILTLDVGFPEECCHAFCVSCILKWSETSTSCPVDRKPFQAIYKKDPVGSWTKISVKERRPRENLNCVCDQTLPSCTKGNLCFRVHVKEEETSEIATPHKENRFLDYKEKPDMEVTSLSWPNCFTGDIAACPSNLSETPPGFSNGLEQEESEVCLIRHKREALKHLRIPFGAEGVQCNSTVPAEILIHSPSFLDEYILPLRHISFTSKDSNRMCAHTGAQEGTEKKQAASGTSTNRGTRKKSVQSSTRRRSTRNSKSDASNLQSSPKSSSSDHDTPGCNTTTNNSASEHHGKQPSKQRKRAPKKGSQARKRLRSATHSQEDSKDDKEDSESEQEKKCKMSEDDLSESELYKINHSPKSSTEKEYHQADMSSPLDHSEEKHLLDSSPAHTVLSVNKEISGSPDLHSKDPFDIEHASPSLVFKNGQTDVEDTHADLPTSVNNPSGMDSAENQLNIEGKPTCDSENLKVSDGESSSSSPGSSKHIISDHIDLPPLSPKVAQFNDEESASSSSSCTEIKSPKNHLQDSPSLKEIDVNAEIHLHTSQVNLQSNESHFENMESSKLTDSTVPLELVKQNDLDYIPQSPGALKEQSIQNLQELGPDDSLKTVHNEQAKVESDLQENCIEEQGAKTCITSESDDQHNADCSVNIVELSEQSLAKNSTDTGDIKDYRLCSEETNSPISKDGKIQDTDEKNDLKSEPQKDFCEDNIEPIAMECDSVCSDHNDSEVEKSVEITEPTKTESDTLFSNKVPLSPPKQSLPPGDTNKKESRTRKSRFHSPSTTWSPSKMEVKDRERSRSPSKVKDSPLKPKSRSRSRDKDGERSHGGQWKGRSRDRHHRRHSRSRSRHSRSKSRHSKSKSKSRSRSGSRTRNRNRSVTVDRNEKDCTSPPWKERRSNENWKSPRGSEKSRRNEHDKNENFRNEKYDARDSAEAFPDNKNDYPDWVVEKMKSGDGRGRGDTWMRGGGRGDRGWGDTRGRGDRARGRGDFWGRGEGRGRGERGRGGNRGRGSHWEDDQYGSGDSWNRNVNMDWNSPRSRGGRGGFRGGFNYEDQNENNWNRPPYSGNSNTLGQEFSRFPENKNNKPKYEDSYEPPADRSGWSSASSWAVRKTLPADVQNYYSKRGRNPPGSQAGVWPKPEESQDQDQATKDQAGPQNESTPVPVNMVQTQMNVVQQPIAPPPQPMNMFPYSVGVHPPLVNIQHNPYNLHPQLPIHLHPALPLVQVSAPSSVPQGLPPPPPPPPPSQQISYIVPHLDGKPLQKIQIQEKAAHEVKVAIKQYYQNKDITKDEYKEIVKKAVDKVCHSKSGEVNSAKVANLVKAYVDKYKHSRKKGD
ncbi:protein SCAF11 isoform X2 [Rhinoderma darwinii]|uniref:protein SCAF11 isoform X2 n=1 Tax=Rhinoderma darwinii TaxID=43563 RepID=UPI003F673514